MSDPDARSKKTAARHFFRRWYFMTPVMIVLILVAGLALLSVTAKRPDHLGIHDGRLAGCPDTPNCVASYAQQKSQKMDPIPFDGSTEGAISQLKDVIEEMPRSRLISSDENYLHVEFSTAVFRFTDDVEFLIDSANSVIHFRAASRVGHSDLGANRKRMNKIIHRFTAR